ncbi:MAG TPA: hypothetical protein VK469_06730 [Candidatus Kapabacteria bacterium]|nr:hypothetical protein [Candidatus Kapabacteria bacterium]
MEDTESITNEANTWASLIPDFFYVLIGRAIPGCLFIIGLVYALDKTIIDRLLLNESITLNEPSIALKYDPPYTFIFILLLIVSYASGLMLSFIGDWLGRKSYIPQQYRKMLEDFPNIIEWLWDLAKFKKNGLPKNWESKPEVKKFCEGVSDEQCIILFQRQHDYVKQEYAHQARSLSRSEAEGQLLIITAAAYLLLSVIQILIIIFSIFPITSLPFSIFQILSRPFYVFKILRINFCNEFSQRWVLLIIFAVIAIFFLFAAEYRNKRFLMRQFSFSAEIKRREENPEKPKNKNGGVIIVCVQDCRESKF